MAPARCPLAENQTKLTNYKIRLLPLVLLRSKENVSQLSVSLIAYYICV